MAGGYIGKVLFVDLTNRRLTAETPEEKTLRDFLGGYGLGARILYSRQKGGVDPLGPDNTLGFVTGPLTGARGLFSSRYTVVAKSPLTGGWGDANSGGFFGPHLKSAGYDAIFVTGASDRPVYLLINNGKAEIKDASRLWGKDTHETEDVLKSEVGKGVRVACIGPAGEKMSLISAVINDKGRAAARSGLGAVMGSKKLKAVAVAGTQDVPLADKDKAAQLSQEYRSKFSGMLYSVLKEFGTAGTMESSVRIGDAPVKNWGGIGMKDFPHSAAISDVQVINLVDRKFGCWGCPVVCGGIMKVGTEYEYQAGVHKPEYETLASFGSLCLNDNLESIVAANDICNRYGLDTISAGSAIAFAIECFENGLITTQDTDGIALTWGDHRAIIAMTQKLARREGFGDVLADGVKRAAGKIGKGAEKYAFHVGGQEIAMHDPRYGPSYGGIYEGDPTPARHTQCGLGSMESRGEFPEGIPPMDKYTYTGKGFFEMMIKNMMHSINASGFCLLIASAVPQDALAKLIAAATGWDYTLDEVLKTGERVANIRQAFNCREGLKPVDFKVDGRPIGKPPLKEGPVANVTVDADAIRAEYFLMSDWDLETGRPSKKKLEDLGLHDVARDLWP